MITALLCIAVVAVAAILHVCYSLIPRFSEGGIYFTVTVPEGFPASAEGLRIHSAYRRSIVVGSVIGLLAGWLTLAVLHALHIPPVAHLFALLAPWICQEAAMYYGMLRARREVRAAVPLVAPEESPEHIQPRRTASLAPRKPPYSLSLWIGPFAMLVLAAALFRSAQIPLWTNRMNALLFLSTAGSVVLLFVLALEVPKFRRLHLSGDRAEDESSRHVIMQWAMLLGSYLLSWHPLVQWMTQTGLVNAVAAFFMIMGPFILMMAIVWLRFVITFRTHLGPGGFVTSPAGDKTPDSGWYLGVLYCNRADPSIFVRHRWGTGWTMNLGNLAVQAVMVLGGLIFVTILVVTHLRIIH